MNKAFIGPIVAIIGGLMAAGGMEYGGYIAAIGGGIAGIEVILNERKKK